MGARISTTWSRSAKLSLSTHVDGTEGQEAIQLSDNFPDPSGSGHLDRVVYRSIRFYGARLSGPLAEAARYVEELERLPGPPPHVFCVYQEFSGEDEGSAIAWQVTVVFSSEPPGFGGTF
jgi:hypothetical protein